MATNYKEGLSRIQPHTWKIAFIFAFSSTVGRWCRFDDAVL